MFRSGSSVVQIPVEFRDRVGFGAYADAVDEALADADPWRAFCAYVERVCAMQAADCGFTDVLTVTFPTAKLFEAERNRAGAGLAELIARAKATGKLRADFAHQDMVMVLMANAGVVSATTHAAQDTWRRLVAYLLQSFAAEAAAAATRSADSGSDVPGTPPPTGVEKRPDAQATDVARSTSCSSLT
jgi:hypothetical protein